MIHLKILLFFITLNIHHVSVFASESVKAVEGGEKISLDTTALDSKIETKLQNIFKSIQKTPNMKLKALEGVVVLEGLIESSSDREWIHKIIENTKGVIAIIDQTEEKGASDGNYLQPAQNELNQIFTVTSQNTPYFISALIILAIFFLFAFAARRVTNNVMRRTQQNPLVIRTISNFFGVLFLVLGLYLALSVSGLSALAVTLLGGTGMIGLGIGLALKNIFENYASSIMISVKNLLKMGELVNINGHEGVVQSVTTRGTTLVDYDGNHIVIPNTEVFNSTIKNYTRNPKMRISFGVGIGYEDNIEDVKSIILSELSAQKNIVLNQPQPLVAVDELGASTVNLKVYFWIDAERSSSVKVKSHIINLIKVALMKAQISMPDDAREVVFASPLKLENAGDKQQLNLKDQLNSKNLNSKPALEKPEHINSSDTIDDEKNEIDDLRAEAIEGPKIDHGENLV
jgi:small-conductance mechanosensitive channel